MCHYSFGQNFKIYKYTLQYIANVRHAIRHIVTAYFNLWLVQSEREHISELFTAGKCGVAIIVRSSLSVCPVRALTFESVDLENSLLVIVSDSTSRPSLYIKVVRSKPRSQKHKAGLCVVFVGGLLSNER